MTEVSRSRQTGETELTPAQIQAGVSFLREFMGDEYPVSMRDADDLVRGLYAAIDAAKAKPDEAIEEVLFEIRTWDHGRGFSPEELVKRLRLALAMPPKEHAAKPKPPARKRKAPKRG